MIAVLAAIFAAVTFPGVVVREATHLFLVRRAKLAIFEVRFLQLKPPFGYVHHEHSRHYLASFFEVLGPFLLNSALCAAFCVAAYLPVWELRIYDPLAWLFYWLGLSLGMHALPATEELKHLWQLTPGALKRANPLAVLALPLLALTRLIDAGRVVLADMAYGVALGLLLPLALFRLLA